MSEAAPLLIMNLIVPSEFCSCQVVINVSVSFHVALVLPLGDTGYTHMHTPTRVEGVCAGVNVCIEAVCAGMCVWQVCVLVCMCGKVCVLECVFACVWKLGVPWCVCVWKLAVPWCVRVSCVR